MATGESARKAPGDTSYEISPVGIGLALAGAVTLVIGVFLPRVEDTTSVFSTVAENTLIQSGDGWIFIGLAVGITGAVYRAWKSGRRGWAVVVLAVIALVCAIYLGTNEESRTLYQLDESGNPDTSSGGTVASAGIGIYVVGVGGLLALLGGVQMRRDAEVREAGSANALTSDEEPTKHCPECAERVLAAAKVCKHCGNRFDDA